MTLVASATTAGAATTASGSANSGGSFSSELTQLQSLLTTLTQNLAAASVGTGTGSETTSSLLPPPPPPTGSSAAAASPDGTASLQQLAKTLEAYVSAPAGTVATA